MYDVIEFHFRIIGDRVVIYPYEDEWQVQNTWQTDHFEASTICSKFYHNAHCFTAFHI